MCLLALLHRAVPEAPVLVAANREERFDRPALPPDVQPGRPRVLCGIDRDAGGTWLGVNEHGLLVAVTNRPISTVPPQPRSRGLLCRELLECRLAREAADRARQELARGRYAGANYLCVDPSDGLVVHGDERLNVVDLEPGLHLLTNGDVDDPDDERQRLARRLLETAPLTSATAFIAASEHVCAHPGIVVRRAEGGTVSCDQVAITSNPDEAVYRYAPGPPDTQPFDDHSARLRELLAAGAIASQGGGLRSDDSRRT